MGARGCLGPLLLLLLPPLPWGEHRGRGSGVASGGSGSLAGAVAGAGGDGTWLQPSIIGGHEAEKHSRPYMASLQFGEHHFCGAALLHRRWALTAAHCLHEKPWDEAELVVGLHNLRDSGSDTQRFRIQAACPHPGYDNDTMENDLLLLQLEGKVKLGKTRRLISLPRREPKPGERCSLAGWGIRVKDGEASPTLQELEVTVMDARMCNNSRFWKGTITSTMICFQGQLRGSAPAKGDSGSPLVCGKRPAVAGVMSFSSKNPTDPLKPPVATSTVKYKKWIQKTLRRGCRQGQTEHPFLFTQGSPQPGDSTL